jgi:hypothetical protein
MEERKNPVVWDFNIPTSQSMFVKYSDRYLPWNASSKWQQ